MSNADFAYDPLDPRVLENPYPYYAHLRRHAPVYRVPAHGFWVVSRYEDVLNVLRRPERFSSAAMAAAVTRPRQFAPDRGEASTWVQGEDVSIVGTDGARHTRLRNVVSRGFTPARIAALEPRVRSIARALAAPWLESGHCEFLADFAVPYPVTVIAEILGIDAERRADFKRWSDAAILGVFESVDAEQGRRVGESLEQMGDYFDAVIEERRRRPGADLVSALVRAEEEHGALTTTEVKTFVLTLLVAGSITTTHLLANAMRALVGHPDQLARVCADPALVPAFVEEALRWDGPVQLLLRTASEDVELAGVVLRKGDVVAPLFASANRDETVFPDPDRFDVTRNPKDHIAFGHGIHFCLGAALARLEARIAFETLLARMRKPVLEEAPPPPLASLVFRGPRRLPLRFGVSRAAA
jgi:cytochrome P450